jgi:hypothetical protein
MTKITEIFALTNEVIEREPTDVEFKQMEKDAQERAKQIKLDQAEAVAKAKAKAELLDRLGITEDEAKLLLA